MNPHSPHTLQWRARRAESLLHEVNELLEDFIDNADDLVTEAICVVACARIQYEKHIMEGANDE